MRPTLLILLGAVALVLLIACANLTTMLLARAAAHEREMAIRVALGAGPLRVLRQVLTESVMLALLGGVAGILLAIWGVDLLKSIGAQTVPRLREVNLDLRVLITTFAVSVGTGIVFGLVPGLASAKPELTESLKEGGRSSTAGQESQSFAQRARHRGSRACSRSPHQRRLAHEKFCPSPERQPGFRFAPCFDGGGLAPQAAISRRQVDRSL